MNAIETYQLTKYYGKIRGITDLSLAVKQGEFFGFIGPNGAGKSTTIRLLMGLIHPTSGTSRLLGMDVARNQAKIRENIGYIPSEAMFYSGTSVQEILKLSARLRKKDCSREAQILCERLQLDPSRKTDDLSLGNRKKTAIVCALQHHPELCIFDEPTSGLDPLIQKEFFQILKERNREGATIFLSSHILSEVQEYCGRAAIIREGRMAACGDMADLAGTDARRVTLRGVRYSDLKSVVSSPVNARIRDITDTGNTLSFLYQGNIKELADRLTGLSYTDLTITEPDLNEIFMHYYEGGNAHDADDI